MVFECLFSKLGSIILGRCKTYLLNLGLDRNYVLKCPTLTKFHSDKQESFFGVFIIYSSVCLAKVRFLIQQTFILILFDDILYSLLKAHEAWVYKQGVTRPMPIHHQLQWVWYELADLSQKMKRQTQIFFSSKQRKKNLRKSKFKVAKVFHRKPKGMGFEHGKQHTACIIDTCNQASMGLLATTHFMSLNVEYDLHLERTNDK